MIKRNFALLNRLAAALIIAAYGPVSIAAEYYSLDGMNSGGAAVTLGEYPAIGIGPVTLPKVIDRNELVTRDNDTLTMHPAALWRNGLANNITRTLGENLSRLLGSSRVASLGDAKYPLHARVSLEVARFDGRLGGEVVLEVQWTIFDEVRKKIFQTGRTRVTDTAQDDSTVELIAAQSRLLAFLSREIAENIEASRHVK